MLIVLFAVCAVFGIACIALWAALSSVRLRLTHAEAMLVKLLDVVEQHDVLAPEERKELRGQVEVLLR